MTDKRVVGEGQQLLLLEALHRFGWLTARMVSALVWAEKSQGLALARRALARLADDKQVLKRKLPDGSGDCYLLGAKGARRLAEEYGVEAKSGQSLALGNSVHRACSNWYLIDAMRTGVQIWTEYEIQTGRAPVVSFEGKVPDGLIECEHGLVWVEVENAWKNRAERERIVRLCEDHLGKLDRMTAVAVDRYLFRVAIVSTNEDALRVMVASFREAHAKGFIRDMQMSEVEVALLPVSNSLVPGDVLAGNLWYDLVMPPIEPSAA